MYKFEVDLSLEFGFLYIKCRSISHIRTLLYGQFVQSITILLDSSIHIFTRHKNARICPATERGDNHWLHNGNSRLNENLHFLRLLWSKLGVSISRSLPVHRRKFQALLGITSRFIAGGITCTCRYCNAIDITGTLNSTCHRIIESFKRRSTEYPH